MNDEKIKYAIVIIAALMIIFGLGWIYYSKNTQPATTITDQNQTNQTAKTSNVSKLPPLFIGRVVKVDGEKIYITSGSEEKIAVVSSKTKLDKQVVEKTLPKNVAVALTDFKKSDQVVVYYSGDPVNKEYKADRVTIIE